jgi:hypothetical protein
MAVEEPIDGRKLWRTVLAIKLLKWVASHHRAHPSRQSR